MTIEKKTRSKQNMSKENLSMMISLVPPVKALSSAETAVGKFELTAYSEEQKNFIKFFEENLGYIKEMPGVKGLLSSSPQEIAAFFQENGININISSATANALLIAGISDFFGIWSSVGKEATIETPYGIVKGALLKDIRKFYVINETVVACVEAIAAETTEEARGIDPEKLFKDHRFDCYFAVAPKRPMDEYDLFAQTKDLSDKVHCSKESYGRFKGLGFPIATLEAQHAMDWMNGLCVKPGFTLEQAVESNTLQLDKKGFKAKSGFSGSITLGGSFEKSPDPFVIKKPYFFWIEKAIEKDGEKKGILVFSAYISADDFQIAEENTE